MPGTNVLLAYPNRADESTLTGGSWSAGLPLANLLDRRIRRVARSSDLAPASTQFTVALPKLRPIRVLLIVGHTLSVSARYRITWADDPGFSKGAGTTEWQAVWPRMFATSELNWEDDNFWLGTLSSEDAEGYPATLRCVLPTAIYKRYWKFEIIDTGNAAGYVDLGRLFLGDGWQPAWNLSYGGSIGWEDKTSVSESFGGEEYFGDQPRYRVMRFRLQSLNQDEWRRVFEMQRQLGVAGELFVSYDGVTESIDMLRKSFLGRLRQLSPIEHPYPASHSIAFEIKEIR